MNPEIVKGQIRSLLIAVGGMVAGWFMYKGWLSQETWTAILNSPVAAGAASMAAAFVWSAMTHRQSNAAAVVAEIAKDPASPVKGVIFEPTIAGRELARSISGTTAVVAGTHEAHTIAAKTV